MFATIKTTHRTENYKYCKASTKNMKNIFGDAVKRVFLENEEYSVAGRLDERGDWSGLRLLVEFSNGRFIYMNNSEWADFHYVPDVEIN